MSVLGSARARCLIALAVVGVVACGNGSTTHVNTDARPAAFRDADIYDTADASIVQQQLPDCPASCDDQNPCTVDSCDPDTHLCRNDPGVDGISCVSIDLCSLTAACNSGLCVGTKTKDCTLPPDQCHESGYCLPTTGLCTYPNSSDKTGCDDGNLCTTGDQCIAGVCQGAPVQCGAGVTCDPRTGECPGGFPTAIWGLALDPSAATAVQYSSFSDLTVSQTGALYFTASFANSLDLGAGSMSTTSTTETAQAQYDYNAVIARMDPGTGKAVWSKSLGDKADQAGCSIAVNANDRVLVSGFYNGRIDFGPAQSVDGGSLAFTDAGSFSKVFLVAVDGTLGATMWALSMDISANSGVDGTYTKVVVDPHDGNFVFCASPSKLVVDLGATHAGGLGDVLIAKLEAQTGRVLWVQQFGSAADESCDRVTVDANGKVYITGHLTAGGTLDLGNGILLPGPSGKSQQAAYVAQLDAANGTVSWGKVFYSQGNKIAGRIAPSAIATDGTWVWFGGSFTYSAAFGDYVLPPNLDAGVSSSNSSTTAFVAALDATSGEVQWAQNWGVTAQVYALALTSTGNLLLGGDYASGVRFDTGQLADSGGEPRLSWPS